MAKEATVRARIEQDTKTQAEEIITKLGLTTSQVINILYQQIILNKGLPFEVKVPNAETIAAMEDTESEIRHGSPEQMFKDLGI